MGEAAAWLSRTFSFVEHCRYGDEEGVQMHLGEAWIMLHRGEPPAKVGHATQS